MTNLDLNATLLKNDTQTVESFCEFLQARLKTPKQGLSKKQYKIGYLTEFELLEAKQEYFKILELVHENK